MSDKYMTVNIITPDGVVYNHKSHMVIAKAIDGDLGILVDHEPIVAPLEIADLRVLRADDPNHENHIAVNGGFLEFNDNVCSVVADSAERPRNIDLRRAEQAKKRAEEHLEESKKKNDKDSRARAEISLARAINRIHVSKNYQD